MKKIMTTLSFVILFNGTLSIPASAIESSAIQSAEFIFGDSFSLFRSNMISTKRSEKYDEAKDPALRKGTENWEEPQGSFFAVPAAVVGVIVLILFFNRK